MSFNRAPNSGITYPGTRNNNPSQGFMFRRDPASSDYKNFIIGDEWINLDNGFVWKMVAKTGTYGTWHLLGSSPNPPIEFVNVDASTAPGTDPIEPDVNGTITLTGGQVAAGTTANVIRTNSLAASSATIEIQRATTAASSTLADNGVSHFDSAYFTIDSNGFVSINGSAIGQTITGDVGGALSPTAGNWNILGTSTAAGTVPVQTSGSGSTLTVQVQKSQAIASTNATNVGLAAFNSAQFSVDANGFVSALDLHVARYIVSPDGSAAGANYTTIGAALAAATLAGQGDIIYIQPGIYQEDLILSNGINFSCAANAQPIGGPVVIKGKMYDNGTQVNCEFNGIDLQTNGDYALELTGPSQVTVSNGFIEAIDNTAIHMNNVNANIYLQNTDGDLVSSTDSFFEVETGDLWNFNCSFTNTGESPGVSTIGPTGGVLISFNSQYQFALETSGNGSIGPIGANGCRDNVFDTSDLNIPCITTAGTQPCQFTSCSFYSGTASAISIGTGTSVTLSDVQVHSSNTNVITGTGALQFDCISFLGSSFGINVSTISAKQFRPGVLIDANGSAGTTGQVATAVTGGEWVWA